MKEKKFTLKTIDGSKRLLALCLILILLGAFFARLIMSDFGTIKIQEYNIDARGATLNGELMYPAGTTSDDKLPCVVVVHGTGCTYGVVRHFCSELARRGYVALAVSTYGEGLGEQPVYEELHLDKFSFANSPLGVLDVVNFARTLSFVDQERIGVAGHSAGAYHTMLTAMSDCGFLSYNDTMINVLADTFGQTFTAEEINMDAAELAAQRLNADQLAHYNDLAEAKRIEFDKNIKAIFTLGCGNYAKVAMQAVTVGGHEVQRNIQTNVAALMGTLDYGYLRDNPYYGNESARNLWQTDEAVIQENKWYSSSDETASCEVLGDFGAISIANNEALFNAIENRDARVAVAIPNETHSRNFFSQKTCAAVIDYFEQTLNYNNGNLTDGAVPTSSGSQIWPIARVGNIVALFAACAMVLPLLAILVNTKFYKPVLESGTPTPSGGKFSKKKYWIYALISVVYTWFVTYYTNNHISLSNGWFNLGMLGGISIRFICGSGLCALLLLLVKMFVNKKEEGSFGIAHLNLGLKPVGVIKSFLIAFSLIGAMYMALMCVEYLFKEDFRFWMTILSEMKVEYWILSFKYALAYILPFLFIGACINYNLRTDIPAWKDDLATVVIGSAGLWILCAFSYIWGVTHPDAAALYSNFFVSYQLVIWVPVTLYMLRKMYRITNNLWTGAVFCSCLMAWSMASEIGAQTKWIGIGQTWISIFFNA